MRILHLNVLYPPDLRGGSERFVASLAEEQAKRGHQVAVVTLGRAIEPPAIQNGVTVFRIGHADLFWFEEWESHSAPVRYLNKLLSIWNPITLGRVRDVVKSFKPDVMNTHCMLNFATNSWTAAAERKIPIVHALHEFNLVCRNTNAFRNGHMCETFCMPCRYNMAKRWMSGSVSAVVGVSQDVLQRHLDYGFFHHIPEHLRAVIWSMPPIPLAPRPAFSADKPFTIGFIGRIVPEKGLDTLLEAVKRLPNENWMLKIAGRVSPPLDEAAMRASVAHLPVEWTGVVPAPEFYPQIDVLVVPPIWADPGPLVVHEAFANGVPVVGTRMGGIKDMVETDKTGWLFEPHDVDALSQILTTLIQKGRSALPAQKNFAPFQERTTPDKVAAQYEEIYRRAIGEISH